MDDIIKEFKRMIKKVSLEVIEWIKSVYSKLQITGIIELKAMR